MLHSPPFQPFTTASTTSTSTSTSSAPASQSTPTTATAPKHTVTQTIHRWPLSTQAAYLTANTTTPLYGSTPNGMVIYAMWQLRPSSHKPEKELERFSSTCRAYNNHLPPPSHGALRNSINHRVPWIPRQRNETRELGAVSTAA